MKTLALTSLAIAALAAPPVAVASDGGTIAYHEFDENGAAQLWSAPAAGGAATQLTSFAQFPNPELCFEFCFSEHPDWAYDGSRIYFDSDRAGTVHVFSMAPDGGDVQQVTHSDGGFEGLPGISPDGTLVAYDGQLDDTGAAQGIYVAPVDESGPPMRLTTGPKGGYDTAPEFSPDGSQLAFVRFRPVSCPDTPRGCRRFNDTGFKGSVYVIGLDGQSLRRLTDPGRVWGDPQWAPDGSKLLIQSYDDPRGRSRGLTSDLWTINPDGSGVRAVTHTKKEDVSFSGDWSPSGDEITFVHFQFPDEHLEIQRMALDGSGRTTVTACGQFAFCDVPNWGIAAPLSSVATASGARARAARAGRARVRHPRRMRRLQRQVRASVRGYPARLARFTR
jgi:Tol biopolymer transport system component